MRDLKQLHLSFLVVPKHSAIKAGARSPINGAKFNTPGSPLQYAASVHNNGLKPTSFGRRFAVAIFAAVAIVGLALGLFNFFGV